MFKKSPPPSAFDIKKFENLFGECFVGSLSLFRHMSRNLPLTGPLNFVECKPPLCDTSQVRYFCYIINNAKKNVISQLDFRFYPVKDNQMSHFTYNFFSLTIFSAKPFKGFCYTAESFFSEDFV